MNGRPELSTRTSATVDLVEDFTPDGAPTWVVVIKQRFGFGLTGAPWPLPGAEVLKADLPWDPDADLSSLRLPSDIALYKPATDVIVVGEAVTPGEAPAPSLDVVVRVGELTRVVTVTGPRVWYDGAAGLTPTPPEPFARAPLRWELAWGGGDVAAGRFDARNPFGCGVADDPRTLVHRPAPRIEDPRAPVTAPAPDNLPAGLGAVSPFSAWRLPFAGTMDARWQRTRMPLRPEDFDVRFFQQAPPGLVTDAPLRGGEPVTLGGLFAGGPCRFDLPRVAFAVWARTDGARSEHRVTLDTVLLRTAEGLLEMVWRTRVPVPASPERLRAVQVYEREVVA